jgi:hypothetical protein
VGWGFRSEESGTLDDFNGLYSDLAASFSPLAVAWHLEKLPKMVLQLAMGYMVSVESVVCLLIILCYSLKRVYSTKIHAETSTATPPSLLDCLLSVCFLTVTGYQLVSGVVLGNLNWSFLVHLATCWSLQSDSVLVVIFNRELLARFGCVVDSGFEKLDKKTKDTYKEAKLQRVLLALVILAATAAPVVIWATTKVDICFFLHVFL